jgi:hypothetical protein
MLLPTHVCCAESLTSAPGLAETRVSWNCLLLVNAEAGRLKCDICVAG